MKVLRVVPNMSSERFEASRDFYMGLFDMVVSVELGGWYLQLMAPEDRSLNVGFLQPGHEFFGGRPAPPGRYSLVLTVQVDDVDEAYAHAQRRSARIPPRYTRRGLRAAALSRHGPERPGAQRDERHLNQHAFTHA